MDRRRTFWLVMWPAVSVLAALVVGVAALGAASLAAEPDGAGDAEGLQLVLDRAVASGDVAVAELTSSPALGASVVLAVLAWLVVLGVGAQRYFPERRRLAPAVLAVLVAVAVAVLAVTLADPDPLTVGGVVPVAAVSALIGGVVVFPLAGYRWRAPAPHHHHEPAVYAHLADIL